MTPCETTCEDKSSNVKPPTVQKGLMVVESAKVQADPVKVTAVPGAMVANDPVGLLGETWGLIQEVTSVAVPADDVSNVTLPTNPMLPVMLVAWRVEVKARATAATPAILIIFFIVLAWFVVVLVTTTGTKDSNVDANQF